MAPQLRISTSLKFKFDNPDSHAILFDMPLTVRQCSNKTYIPCPNSLIKLIIDDYVLPKCWSFSTVW